LGAPEIVHLNFGMGSKKHGFFRVCGHRPRPLLGQNFNACAEAEYLVRKESVYNSCAQADSLCTRCRCSRETLLSQEMRCELVRNAADLRRHRRPLETKKNFEGEPPRLQARGDARGNRRMGERNALADIAQVQYACLDVILVFNTVCASTSTHKKIHPDINVE